MKRLITSALVLLSGLVGAQAQIALTPKNEKAPLDGTFIDEQVMPAGPTRIRFSLPDRWTVAAGSENSMTLTSETGDSRLVVEVTNGPTPHTFEGLRAMLKDRPLPDGAAATGGAEVFEPGPAIAGAPTWSNRVEYDFGGLERIRTIWFLPLSDAQLRFILDESADRNPATLGMAGIVMSSWYWEDASQVKPLAISGDPGAAAR